MEGPSMKKALKELAEEAIACQDACNLSGVVHCYSTAMTQLWAIAHEQKKGTDWVNTHPVAFLFAYKCMALAGYEPLSAPFEKAYLACEEILKED